MAPPPRTTRSTDVLLGRIANALAATWLYCINFDVASPRAALVTVSTVEME